MENNKMTAVEWLIEHMCGEHTNAWQKEINQALQMEKEQIIEAYVEGINEPLENPKKQSEQYYKQTYGK